jgi:sugar phosphate isomerase/epimerase
VSVNSDPGSFDGRDGFAAVQARIGRLLEFCAVAGAALLVLPCGEKRDDPAVPPDLAALAGGLNVAAAEAGTAGIRLAVEVPYWGRPVDGVARAVDLLDLLDPRIEIAFDISHVHAAGDSVLDAWDVLGPRAGVIHLRDAVRGDIRRVIGAGTVDFEAFFARLRLDAPDLVLELETLNSPFVTKEDEVQDAVNRLTQVRRTA